MNLKLHYDVPGDDFTRAGEASGAVKRKLKQLGFPSDLVRRVAIAMYEGEINMVIHAGGGEADVEILPDRVVAVLTDHGPAFPTLKRRCRRDGLPLLTMCVPSALAPVWDYPTSKNIPTTWISPPKSGWAPSCAWKFSLRRLRSNSPPLRICGQAA